MSVLWYKFLVSNSLPDHMIRSFENQTKQGSEKSNVWILGVLNGFPISKGIPFLKKWQPFVNDLRQNDGHFVQILNGPKLFGWRIVQFSNGWDFLDTILYSCVLVLFLNGQF